MRSTRGRSTASKVAAIHGLCKQYGGLELTDWSKGQRVCCACLTIGGVEPCWAFHGLESGGDSRLVQTVRRTGVNGLVEGTACMLRVSHYWRGGALLGVPRPRKWRRFTACANSTADWS